MLDILSGRYPSDDFAELKPRITWDRLTGSLTKRSGAQLAVINGGTIPDRGLYGVFLAGPSDGKPKRVGEPGEEMVLNPASEKSFSWARRPGVLRLPDRVLVSPAPGRPGKMPFWHGDKPGRPSIWVMIGQFLRKLVSQPREEAIPFVQNAYSLDINGARNLVDYVEEQIEASTVPTDKCVVLERSIDEIGDWRIAYSALWRTSPRSWAMAVRAQLLEEYAIELDVVWGDDGIVFRLPEGDTPPTTTYFFRRQRMLKSDHRKLADTSLFAARFRENAGRSLLLPKKRPGGRSPLWALRRRAASLLSVASRYRDFPIILETYRECLQDQFDMAGLRSVLNGISQRRIKVVSHELDNPSPFAASLMFKYVASFI